MRGSSGRTDNLGRAGPPFFRSSLIGLDVSSEGGNDGRAFVDVREPGVGIGREIAKGERAETEIDSFIARRHEQRRKSEPERELEAVWRAPERVQEAARRREARAGWYSWHDHRAELYARLSAEHAATAEELMQDTDERMSA